jgi:glycerophosphoryl diester phosphodiesterase
MVDGELGDTQEVRTMTDSASEATGRIFISYRRQDSAYPAGWLYDRLAERFGPDQIFKDVDSIELGDDFVETITNAVGSCDILLTLIGQDWLDIAGSDGSRRLDDPDDFVRLEIEAALQREVLLIPILVEGALMPRADQLPPSIAPLVRRQALELSPTRFRADTERLLDVMERTLANLHEKAEESTAEAPEPAPVKPPKPAKEPRPEATPFRMTRGRITAAVASVLAVAALIWVLLPDNDPDGDGKDDPTVAPTSAAAEPPKLGGASAPVVLAHRGGDEQFAWQTLPAFEHAAGIGAAVETDVRWSKDGTPVLVHDPGTTPGMECEGGNKIVEDTTWSVLERDCRSSALASKDGKQYGIPTLDQAVAAVAKTPGAEIFPEIKVVQSARQVRQFVTILKSVKMTGRTVITSALPKQLDKIRTEAQNDGVEDLRLMQFVSGTPVPLANLVDGLWGVAVRFDTASLAYVKELQAADLKVMVWNINSTEQWEEATRVGADIVMTDRPAGFGQWFEER